MRHVVYSALSRKALYKNQFIYQSKIQNKNLQAKQHTWGNRKARTTALKDKWKTQKIYTRGHLGKQVGNKEHLKLIKGNKTGE